MDYSEKPLKEKTSSDVPEETHLWGQREGNTWIIQQSNLLPPVCLLQVSGFRHHPSLPLSVVSVSGFKRGASWTSAKSLLLRVVVEVRQNQNAAFRFGFGDGWSGSLVLYRHDVLHQACDGSVNVHVVLEREDGGEDGWWRWKERSFSGHFL